MIDKESVLLITGGTGTLGQALIRWLPWPGKIRVLSRDEQKQEILRQLELEQVRLILGDIRDPAKLRVALAGVHTVIHCAALKIVPNGNYNPDEMIKTNCVGTLNVIREAIAAGCERVVIISTDKGVNPTTLYGATKMCQEHLALQANNWSPTKISVCRFGNIADSRGSLTLLVQEYKKSGKPFPLTSETMTRFFINQHGAAMFIQFTLDRMTGGEIYVPKLPAKKIMDMIPQGMNHTIVGRRPTERDYEILVGEHELPHTDEFDQHFVIRSWPHNGNTRRKHACRSNDNCESSVEPPTPQV